MRWTASEMKKLARLANEGRTNDEIAKVCGGPPSPKDLKGVRSF